MAEDFLPLVVCDTCVFIDVMTADGADRAIIDEAFLNDAKSGLLRVVVSEVTVTETNRLKSEEDDVLALVEGFLANVYMRRMPVTPAVSWRASTLIRHFKLDTCDALIVATALAHGAHRLYTRDEHSLCKKIRASQNVPCKLVALPKPSPRFPDEKQVIEEVKSLIIVPLSIIKTKAQPVKQVHLPQPVKRK